MKFCNKCHRRVVGKVDNCLDLSSDHRRVCVCRGQGIKLMHDSVIKRYVSEVGVHKMKKIMK